MNTLQDLKYATRLVRDRQNDLGRELTNDERRELLAVSTEWNHGYIHHIVGDLGECVF